jgi:hypothetical protein
MAILQVKALARALVRRIAQASELKALDERSEAMAYARIDGLREALEMIRVAGDIEPEVTEQTVAERDLQRRLDRSLANTRELFEEQRGLRKRLNEANRRCELAGMPAVPGDMVTSAPEEPVMPGPVESTDAPAEAPVEEFPASLDEIAF